MLTQYDFDVIREKLLTILEEVGPVVGQILNERAEMSVAYILIAMPAGIKHRDQALMTNIATRAALKGVLENATACVTGEIRKTQ